MHVPIKFNNILAAIQSIKLYICALLYNHLLRGVKLKLIICVYKVKKVKGYIKKIVRV